MKRAISSANKRVADNEMGVRVDIGSRPGHPPMTNARVASKAQPTSSTPQREKRKQATHGPKSSVKWARHSDAPIFSRAAPDLYSLLCAMGAAALYFTLGVLSLTLFRLDSSLATIWLPNGAVIALLLLAKPRNEVGVYAAVFAASALANMATGAVFQVAAAYSLANLAVIMLVVWLTRRHCGQTPDMSELGAIVRFVWIGGLIGPLVSALLASALMPLLFGGAFGSGTTGERSSSLQSFVDWFLTESMGLVLIVPTGLLIGRAIASRQFPPAYTLVQGAALMTVSLVTTLLVFGQGAYPLLFLVLPVTLMHAFRLGSLGTALHVALVVGVSIFMTLGGHGPIVETSGSETVRLHLI